MNEPVTRSIPVSKLEEKVEVSVAEYELLIRDKTQLNLILDVWLNKKYSSDMDSVMDAVCRMRGMKA